MVLLINLVNCLVVISEVSYSFVLGLSYLVNKDVDF